MKKVYILYSIDVNDETSILGVFKSEKKAKRYKTAFLLNPTWHRYFIDEFDVL